jgi:transcription elongation factor GreA
MTITIGQSDLITREGHQRLQAKLEELVTTKRAEVARWLRDARADGAEPGENVDLSDALEEQALLEREIAELEHKLAGARIVEPPVDGTAGIGTVVRLRSSHGTTSTCQLVGALEADVTRHRVSIESPVGRALLGRVAGDEVEVEAPKGLFRYEIIAIDAADQKAA